MLSAVSLAVSDGYAHTQCVRFVDTYTLQEYTDDLRILAAYLTFAALVLLFSRNSRAAPACSMFLLCSNTTICFLM